MYHFLDVFFAVFHFSLVVFNLTGWIWPRTRRLHLLVIGLTVASWFGLGAVYGWGYCPCTDWHWEVKRRLGETDLPNSYVKYYLDRLTGSSWDAGFLDVVVATAGLSALGISIFLNWQQWRHARA